MNLRARSVSLATAVAIVASPLGAQQSDPARLCNILPPKLGGLDACKEAVKKQPRNASVLGSLAVAYIAVGQPDRAIKTYRSLVALSPDSAPARLNLAKAYDRKGDLKNALEQYREFARLVPEPRARYYVGAILLDMGRFDEALAEFRVAAAQDSLQGRYHYSIGLALAGLERDEEALLSFELATRLRPEDSQIWGSAARTAHSLGRLVQAVFNWDRAVNAQPSYFDRRDVERKHWERSIREIGETRVSAGNRPVQVESFVSSRRSSGTNGKAASFTGSGFWVSSEGHLLTNRHVVKGCREVRVRPDSGKSQSAAVVATDGHDDLALLRSERPYPKVAAFRDGGPVRRGEDVVAVGFPLNGLLADQANVTVGHVSALAGIYNDNHVLQMTTPVQQGNSGGPLFDASGNVVGVVVTKLNARAMAAEIGDFPQNVNFAIKSDIARKFLEANQVRYRTAPTGIVRSNPDIGDMGRVVTVLVECYQ